MSTPTSARRAATRERLVDAAIGVIAHKGVLGSSVEEICEAADFTRGAFYSNFDSKDELCIAILESQATRYLDAVRDTLGSMDASLGMIERIDQAAQLFTAMTGDDPDAILVMSELRLHAAREPRLREAFVSFEATVNQVFGDLIDEGLRTHGLGLTMPMPDALSLLHAVYDQTALDQLIHGQSPSSPEAAQRLGLVLQALVIST